MKKQSKKGGVGNMLLLAGLGVGAALLFAGKTKVQNKDASTDPTQDPPVEIPEAPKILAVNTSATESPTPTGVVSDEAGMEPTAAANNSSDTTDDPEAESGDPSSNRSSSENQSTASLQRSTQGRNVPPVITTPLTPKEKAVIEKGVLTDDLALQRPDLYKAIYIKKHGKNGNRRKALLAANTAIKKIRDRQKPTAAVQKKKRRLSLKLHPKTAAMVLAAKNHTVLPASGKPASKHGVKSKVQKVHPVHANGTAIARKRSATIHKKQHLKT